MDLGLLGGSFDPPHNAHIAIARFVIERFALDRVELVPAFRPPHKQSRPLSSPYHRYAMTALAALDEPGLAASDRELVRGGISYAIDTLREIRAARPESRIFFVLGSDQFAEVPTWREPDAIVREFELIVVRRSGSNLGESIGQAPFCVREARDAGRIRDGAMEPIDLSSTAIRARVRAGQPIEDLVNPRVAQYIDRYELYRSGGPHA